VRSRTKTTGGVYDSRAEAVDPEIVEGFRDLADAVLYPASNDLSALLTTPR
jgi:hypothetical protein